MNRGRPLNTDIAICFEERGKYLIGHYNSVWE